MHARVAIMAFMLPGISVSGVCDGPGIAATTPARALQTFSITAQDSQGKPCRQGGDVFRVVVDCIPSAPTASPAAHPSSTAATVPIAVAVRDQLDGVYTVNYDGALAGVYTISVSDSNGQPLPRSPFRVLVTPGT